jgi:hypothetical protein
MQWIDRVGLLFNFLAFCFAAPELLGEERLKAWRRQIERWSMVIVVLVWFLLLSFLWVGFSDLIPDEMVEMMPTIWLISTTTVLSVVSALPLILPGGVHTRIVRPMVQRWTNDAHARQRSLAQGAILFVLGFVAQLAASFLG